MTYVIRAYTGDFYNQATGTFERYHNRDAHDFKSREEAQAVAAARDLEARVVGYGIHGENCNCYAFDNPLYNCTAFHRG